MYCSIVGIYGKYLSLKSTTDQVLYVNITYAAFFLAGTDHRNSFGPENLIQIV